MTLLHHDATADANDAYRTVCAVMLNGRRIDACALSARLSFARAASRRRPERRLYIQSTYSRYTYLYKYRFRYTVPVAEPDRLLCHGDGDANRP